MTTKRCKGCQRVKPFAEFYVLKRMNDGHTNKCKECTRADVRANRLANLERIQAYDRARDKTPERREKFRVRYARWYERHPERWLAQAALQRAVQRGDVVPQPCWVCGAKAEAHHPDYSRRLDVVWLCTAHHRQTHALVKASNSIPFD